jgi:hypothetical protein
MLYLVLKLKLKQVVGPFRAGTILKFLAPDFLVGIFLALSNESNIRMNPPAFTDMSYAMKLGAVACGISLFTLVAETRKLFFTGGDVEDFYFVQPTKVSRFASLLTVMLVNLVIITAVAVPTLLFVSSSVTFLSLIILGLVFAFLLSSTFYIFIVSAVSSLPKKIANPSLTVIQILMALALLAVFQLPLFSGNQLGPDGSLSIRGLLFFITCILLVIACFMVLLFPVQESLILKLKETESRSVTSLLPIIEKYGRVLFLRSREEEAGILFFFSNIFRGRSFRLSTIGTAATPVMVAVYWALRGFRFVNYEFPGGFMASELVAPLASLVVAGVLAHYFLAQSLLSSKDFEAAWLFEVSPKFSVGKFVLGIRKGFLITVQIPMTIGIFLVTINRNSLLESLIVALTFYFLTHVAASFFSTIQRRLPFTLPYTQISSSGMIDLVFLLGYSAVITFALFVCYDRIESLLMLNLFAFILISGLEFFSARIIDKRIKLGV